MIEKLKNIKNKYKYSRALRVVHKKEARSLLAMQNSIEKEILLLCHALEKGMGMEKIKQGYGKEKALNMLDRLATIQDEHHNSYMYIEGYSVLKAYIEYKKSNGEDISFVESEFNKLKVPDENYFAGVEILDRESVLNNASCDFEKFAFSRRSMRKSSDEAITEDEIRAALKIAARAPSACNRQPSKVWYSLDESKNRQLSKLIPGNKAFSDDIKYYCVITADKSLFGGNEAYQWYLNSGIFIDTFVLALHSLGIGTCIFQWPDFYEDEAEVRKLIKNDNANDAIMAVIGFGKYPEKIKCIGAYRRTIDDIGKKF